MKRRRIFAVAASARHRAGPRKRGSFGREKRPKNSPPLGARFDLFAKGRGERER